MEADGAAAIVSGTQQLSVPHGAAGIHLTSTVLMFIIDGRFLFFFFFCIHDLRPAR